MSRRAQAAIEEVASSSSAAKNYAPIEVRRPVELKRIRPEMVIAKNVVVKADVRFHRLLRVEGTIEGKALAPPEAALIICQHASFLGDLSGLGTVYIDGYVRGNIFVDKLGLGPHAVVEGSVFCKRVEVAGNAIIQGQLHISKSTNIPANHAYRPNAHLVEEQKLSDSEDDDDEDGYVPPVKSAPRHREEDHIHDNHSAVDEEEEDSPSAPAEESKSAHIEQQEEEEAAAVAPLKESLKRKKNVAETVLAIFEPQADFYPGGNWYTRSIPTDDTVDRLAAYIVDMQHKIDRVVVFLDIHASIHPQQSNFWENDEGQQPPPGTVILFSDVASGLWSPVENIELEEVRQHFLVSNNDNNVHDDDSLGGSSLAADDTQLKSIIIQPKHCLIGSPGAALMPQLYNALTSWTDLRRRDVQYIVSTEDHDMPYNVAQVSHASPIFKLVLAGQYQSHCHHTTLNSIATSILVDQQQLNKPMLLSNVCVLSDAISFSPVEGHEDSDQAEYLHELNQMGYHITTTSELVL